MIKQFRVQNYKALRDVTLDLTPIHVLIGPNDSGKTSILEAIAALCRSVDHALGEAFTGSWSRHELVWHGAGEPIAELCVQIDNDGQAIGYELACAFHPTGRSANTHFERLSDSYGVVDFPQYGHTCVFERCRGGPGRPESEPGRAQALAALLKPVHYFSWIPRLLALPVAPDSKRRFRTEPSGFGLALLLDDILGYDRERFSALEERFRQIFPDVRSIKLMPEPAYKAQVDDPQRVTMLDRADGKGLHFEFTGSKQLVSAAQVSDGMLLVLAYLAILHLPEPPRVILVEEPENGIHPKRLRDVLTILRDLVEEQSHTQVIMTTHSPYALDLFEPGEVTLCLKESDGSVSVRRLSKSKKVLDQLDIFTLGEIWTAEGDEALAKPVSQKKAPKQ